MYNIVYPGKGLERSDIFGNSCKLGIQKVSVSGQSSLKIKTNLAKILNQCGWIIESRKMPAEIVNCIPLISLENNLKE